MADDSLREQLVAQMAEQTDALEGLAALLAVDQNPELVQVSRTERMLHLFAACCNAARQLARMQ